MSFGGRFELECKTGSCFEVARVNQFLQVGLRLLSSPFGSMTMIMVEFKMNDRLNTKYVSGHVMSQGSLVHPLGHFAHTSHISLCDSRSLKSSSLCYHHHC